MVSVVLHSAMLIFILFALTVKPDDAYTLKDQQIDKAITVLMIVCFLILPYLLAANLFQVRDKLPIFKRKNLIGVAVGTILSAFLLFVLFGIGYTALAVNYSPEYKAAQEVKRKEQEQKAQLEREARKKAAEDAKIKAAAEKQAKQLADLEAKKKADAEKEAKRQAELDAKAKAEAEKAAVEKSKEEAKAKTEAEQKAKESQKQADSDSTIKTEPEKAVKAVAQDTDIPSQPQKITGFNYYQADGFALQLPTGWSYIISEVKTQISGDLYSLDSKKVPVSEKYNIQYKADDGINYDTYVEILPKKTFEKDKAYYTYGDFTDAAVKNAEASWVSKKFSNSLIEPSAYKVIALRGDVCYIISGYFKGYSKMEASGSYYDYNKKRLEKYLSDMETMISSFELSDKPVDFAAITQSNQPYLSLAK